MFSTALLAALCATLPAEAEPPASAFSYEISGRVEAFYSFVFQQPDNGTSNYRIFDNRHNTFSLSAVGLQFDGSYYDAYLRIALWWGITPTTIYAGEPTASQAGTNGPSDNLVWRLIQEAYLGYNIPVGTGLAVEAGLFVSPIGIEGVRVQDNWNWSSSNLNFGLPFYHAGVRASYGLTDSLKLTVAALNGFGGVVDANKHKSFVLIASGNPGALEWAALYYTGAERTDRRDWLHLFDFWLRYTLTSWMQVAFQVDAGFEPSDNGTGNWVALAGYLRFPITEMFALALRGDWFREHKAGDGIDQHPGLFVPVDWVASGVATLEIKALDHVLLRLEYRHDEAGAPLYFNEMPSSVPNARRQDPLTLGAAVYL